MAYPNQGNYLNYFIPNIPLASATAVPLREIGLASASASHGEFICVQPCKIMQLQFLLAGESAGGTTTAPTVVFKKRPTPLSATGQTTLGVLTIPDATAVGKLVYKPIAPISMAVGDSVEISWTAGVGTPTGKGLASFICEDDPEVPANNSRMLASV